jgi:hypothetical protein
MRCIHYNIDLTFMWMKYHTRTGPTWNDIKLPENVDTFSTPGFIRTLSTYEDEVYKLADITFQLCSPQCIYTVNGSKST